MPIRSFRSEDSAACARLSAACAHQEADFVLNPMWESEAELAADFARHGARAEASLVVASGIGSEVLGVSGVLHDVGGSFGGLVCPLVAPAERGHGLGGELLRAALGLARERGLRLVTAGIGTRNRGGYSLLTALGFRPVRQHFLMRCDARPSPPPAPTGFSLERAGEVDAESVHALYVASGLDVRAPEVTSRALRDGAHLHAVARHAGEACGFVELDLHWPARPWVAFVGVAGEAREQGIGSWLVASALAPLFDAGASCALLALSPANRSALRAYEKVGFRLARVFDVLQREG